MRPRPWQSARQPACSEARPRRTRGFRRVRRRTARRPQRRAGPGAVRCSALRRHGGRLRGTRDVARFMLTLATETKYDNGAVSVGGNAAHGALERRTVCDARMLWRDIVPIEQYPRVKLEGAAQPGMRPTFISAQAKSNHLSAPPIARRSAVLLLAARVPHCA